LQDSTDLCRSIKRSHQKMAQAGHSRRASGRLTGQTIKARGDAGCSTIDAGKRHTLARMLPGPGSTGCVNPGSMASRAAVFRLTKLVPAESIFQGRAAEKSGLLFWFW
jgi:hypothetical protein